MMRALLGEPLRVYARMHHVSRKIRGESLAHACYEYKGATAVIDVTAESYGTRVKSVSAQNRPTERNGVNLTIGA